MPIYLDNNSTTKVDPRVLEAMIPYFIKNFGNAASKNHIFGQNAEEAVDEARESVANIINANPNEIIFTSGATEAINIAIRRIFMSDKTGKNHIVTAATEHKSVLDACKDIEGAGAKITCLPVETDGMIDINKLHNRVSEKTLLVTIMYANNETGVIQPVREIAAIAHLKGALFMTDATQAVGKIPINVKKDDVDIMTFSSHKIYGPKGAGALFIKKKKPAVIIHPWHGTLNVPAIVGLGKACDLLCNELLQENKRIASLRNRLENELLQTLEAQVNGNLVHRLPNTTNISFKGIEAGILLEVLHNEIALATGSACTSASSEPSHVLKAMGLTAETIHSAVRFSLGRFNTEEELSRAVSKIKKTIWKQRKNL